MVLAKTIRAFLILTLAFTLLGQASAASAAVGAPTQTSPESGHRFTNMDITLAWNLPPGAMQYQLQVMPHNNDGPGINLVRNAEGWFTIPRPPYWYILLPDMSYAWRLRAIDKTGSLLETDPAWGPWSEMRFFHTPSAFSNGIQLVSPADGAQLPDARPVTLTWNDPNPSVFYYEVQVSRVPCFNMDPATATSFVYHLLRHGGATTPPNSWTVPVLEANLRYFWRVRPRIQGDGTSVAWGPTWSFKTPPLPVMAFTSNRDGADEIYLENADGTLPMRPSAAPVRGSQPSMSPDGQRIAFMSDRDGDSEIFVVNADGSDVRRLTNHPAADSSPAWSPDGARIAFVSDRDGNDEIYTMNIDGSDVRRLTTHPAQDTSPTWSPDGAAIAFVSDRDGARDIFVMRQDGDGPANLTKSPAEEMDPAWSPSHGLIAFVSNRDGNNEIYTMKSDGTEMMRLTNDMADDNHPAWPPDGSSIAFVSNRNGNSDIYLMPPHGGMAENRTNNSGNDRYPAWPRR
ncbi:MAG: hypothetical protein NTZ05_18755 [Chloroflexi bacterium]|nr:hypothetical protein [Chloroflexota bacterium]